MITFEKKVKIINVKILKSEFNTLLKDEKGVVIINDLKNHAEVDKLQTETKTQSTPAPATHSSFYQLGKAVLKTILRALDWESDGIVPNNLPTA